MREIRCQEPMSKRHPKNRNIILGEQGEDIVIERLKKSLNNSYLAYRNVVLGDPKKEIDILLVGPKGVIILEVKNWNGTFWFACKRLFRKLKKEDYFKRYKSVVDRIVEQKYVVSQMLEQNNLVVPVKALIVLVQGHIENICEPTDIYITNPENIVNLIERYSPWPKFSFEVGRLENLISNQGKTDCHGTTM